MLEQLRSKVQPGLVSEQIYFSQRFPCNLKKKEKETPLLWSLLARKFYIYIQIPAMNPIAKLPYLLRNLSRSARKRRRNHLRWETSNEANQLRADPRILYTHTRAHTYTYTNNTRFNNHVPSTDHILSPRRPLASVTPTPDHPFSTLSLSLSLFLAMHAHRKTPSAGRTGLVSG